MKLIPLVWKGVWHKPWRTSLTLVTIVVAFMLFGLLQGVNQGTQSVLASFNNRLFTGNKLGVGVRLPLAYREKIRAIQGVASVTHLTFFGGYYRDPHNTIPVFATDSSVFGVYARDFNVPKEQIAAFERTPTSFPAAAEKTIDKNTLLGQP